MNFEELSDNKKKEILMDPVLFYEKILGLKTVSEEHRQILRSKSKRICLAAGRRWGKTTTLAAIAIWNAVTHQVKNIGLFAYSWEQCEIFIDAIKDLIEEADSWLKENVSLDIRKKYEVSIENTTIISRSATKTSRSMRGHGVDILMLDEAAFIPDDILKSIRPIREKMMGKETREYLASTPLGHNHFYKAFHSDMYESYQLPVWNNSLVDKKEVMEDAKLLTESEFKQEYEADFIDDRYSVFPQTLIDAATSWNSTFLSDPEKDKDYVMGVDLGRRKDATVLCICHAENNHLFVDLIKEIPNTYTGNFWTKVLDDVEFYVKKFKILNVAIDQTGIGDMPTQELTDKLAKNNVMCAVQGVDFTRRLKNGKEGLVNSLLLKFERKEIHFPLDKKLIRQLKNIRFEATKSPSAKMKTYGSYTHIGHDDYVMALVLALFIIPSSQITYHTVSNDLPTNDKENFPSLVVTNMNDNIM